MNKITDKERKEAIGWVDSFIDQYQFDLDMEKRTHGKDAGATQRCLGHFRTLRSALEEYKPKTVTREWAHLKLLDILMPEGRQVTVIFEEMFKELGIEITEK